jgi:hypothetical protein
MLAPPAKTNNPNFQRQLMSSSASFYVAKISNIRLDLLNRKRRNIFPDFRN